MSEQNNTRIPLLPLRGIIVYPTMVVHLDVGREKSINAVEQAGLENQLILLVSQKDASEEYPSSEDIFEVGTLARIKSMLKLPNDTVRILVEGLDRAKLLDYIDEEECTFASIEIEKDRTTATLEEEALMRTLLGHFEQYTRLSKKVTPETYLSIKDLEEPGRLADIIASNLPLKLKQKQELLSLFDINERLIKLVGYIQDEKELLHLEKKISQRVKASMERTQKEYFLREQMKAIQKELGDKDGKGSEVDELREKIENKGMPEKVLEVALKELDRYESIPTSSAESGVIRNYLDWLVSIPWTEETEERIDLEQAEEILNEDHYGLEKVKERVLEFLAVKKLTNSLKGPILCLVGPPGVGKTSLARSIATALNRNFIRVSLGGVRDESEIRGHRRTYVGAMPGRIIQGMKKAETINPLFLLDEIDKMASDFRGDPASAMLEVLDPEQNHNFSDHYIAEPYDLSKVMFIATANSLATIPGPLLDRMEIISIGGYTEVEKVHIALSHLLPKQMKENGLKKGNLIVKEEAVLKIVRYYTREAGVRSLERVLGSLCRKVAKIIVTEDRKRITITEKNVEKYLGKTKYSYGQAEIEDQVGVATGLAYTSVGGDTLAIEVSVYPGKGKLMLTGKLGDVMKESAQAAFSYISAKAEELHIDPHFREKNDIHIHVPEGAVPKDGPSAGITMATALVSALTNKPIRREVGMTGEITLRGRVLPIGGLKEKSLSAHRAGLTTVILPKDNEKDIEDIPKSVREGLNFIPVSHLDEVLAIALVGEK
ncbi:MAG: endopeptidase La [Bacillaceae bacterium]